MADLKFPVITITREYSAYGRTVARALSEKYGIPFYDKDFIKETAAQSGYTEEEIRREGEEMSKGSRFMNSLLNTAMTYSSSYDNIFTAECEVILKLAAKPCIIVGRCADYVLKNAGVDCFSVYLYADQSVRLARAAELDENAGKSEDEIKKYLHRTDILRATYYKEYTGQEIDRCKNYDMLLDIGKIGVENCIDIISKAVEAD